MIVIGRQAAIDAINEYETNAPEYMQECDCKLIEAVKSDIVGLISELPSAVKHGKWLLHEYPDGYYHTECSECGKIYSENVYYIKKPNYCPNCGALMDKSEDV